MLLDEVAAKNKAEKALVIGKNMLEELRALNGKNLLGIDEALDGKLIDIRKIVTQIASGDKITNIGLEFKDKIVLIATSKGFDHEVFNDNKWFKSTVYIRNTARPDDAEGEYTGPETIVFGMPGELNVVENDSLVSAVKIVK